jgi:class 3 adenylate cyclase
MSARSACLGPRRSRPRAVDRSRSAAGRCRSVVPVGVAANAGVAFVGVVGSGSVMDFTALGDVVNVGARLQAHAQSGEVVLADELYTLIAATYPDARRELVHVRGRDEPVHVAVLRP